MFLTKIFHCPAPGIKTLEKIGSISSIMKSSVEVAKGSQIQPIGLSLISATFRFVLHSGKPDNEDRIVAHTC